jgi:hypothetical protein
VSGVSELGLVVTEDHFLLVEPDISIFGIDDVPKIDDLLWFDPTADVFDDLPCDLFVVVSDSPN